MGGPNEEEVVEEAVKKEEIKYKGGYKYQLFVEYTLKVGIKPDQDIITDFIDLNKDGNLTIKKGYAWDGASFPAINTKTFMRGSLVHDALYQLIRWKRLEENMHRRLADVELRKICIEDGMWRIRTYWVYLAVITFAKRAASKPRPEVIAPEICRYTKFKNIFLNILFGAFLIWLAWKVSIKL